jgi:hypothetical protein
MRLILRRREHRDAPAPRVAEHVPSLDAECGADCDCVTCIVFDACLSCARRLLRFATPALVEENQLLLCSERGKCGPEDIMAEVEAAIDAEERESIRDRRTAEYRKLESARDNLSHLQGRSLSLFFPESEEALASRAVFHHIKLPS